MFDFAWSEIALIGVVALVAIGPKDMPVAIKSVAGLVKKARKMAGEFQVHVDDLMKEADLSEMKGHLNELRSLNLRDTVTRAVDPDGALRATLAERPFVQQATPAASAETLDNFVAAQPERVIHGPPPHRYGVPPDPRPDPAAAPAFIPPQAVARLRAAKGAPAFIPPDAAARGLPP